MFTKNITPRAWFQLLKKGGMAFVSTPLPRDPLKGCTVILFPAFLNFVFAFILMQTLRTLNDIISILIAAWLITSFVITGFPDKFDIAALISIIVASDPSAVFYYGWSIVVFAAFALGYNGLIAILAVFLYLAIITLTIFSWRPRKMYEVILDEGEV